MLSFLPGVSTDDESVQILSRTTHAIYIYGIKIQDYSELKALQASQIESVDIDYMSGVEEAADAQGGVIRIKLKKQADGGFSGYLQASAGANMYGYGGESARNIFRARTGNLSIYNTLAYVRQRYFSDNESEYLFKETGSDILSREEYRSWGGYLSDRLNLSYEINPNHSLAVFGVEGNLKPFKWWTVKPMVSLLLQYAKTSRYTVSNQAMWKFSLSNNFSFSPTFGGTLNAYYEPESRMLDALWKPVAQVNGSLYKTFLDDRLELRLDFTLWRYGRRTIIETPVYMQSVWNRTKETRAELTLTWNFSGGKKVNVRRNADSIQDYKQITDQR